MEPLNPVGLSRRDLLRAAGALGVSFLLPPLDARAARASGAKPGRNR